MTEDHVRTGVELRGFGMQACSEILTLEEHAATSFTLVREPLQSTPASFTEWPSVADSELLNNTIMLIVRTWDDAVAIWGGDGHETRSDLHKRVRSDLQDYVAESAFGWGQLRP